jgi:hypothetical protein
MTEQSPTESPRRIRSLARLLPFVRPYRGLIAGWLGFLALSSAATLTLPQAVRVMIDRGFTQADAAAINASFLGLFAVAAVLALATAARFFFVTLLGERVAADLRRRLYDHLLTLDQAFYERTRTGELVSRLAVARHGNRHGRALARGVLADAIRIEVRQPRIEQGRLGPGAIDAHADAFDQRDALGSTQAFRRASAVGARQPADAQLDAAVPARDDDRDPVQALAIDGGQDRPSGAAAGLAVVAGTVVRADAPCPAVVGRVAFGDARDERGGGLCIVCAPGAREEAALADFLQQARFRAKGRRSTHRPILAFADAAQAANLAYSNSRSSSGNG